MRDDEQTSNSVPQTMREQETPHLFFEITDLLSSFTRSRTPTGIQRVQIEIFKASLKISGGVIISACTYSPDRRGWVQVENAGLCKIIDLAGTPGDMTASVWEATLNNFFILLNHSPLCAFDTRSTLVNLGTSWVFSDYMADLQTAKSQLGLRYIPFVYDLIPIILPESVDYWVEPAFKKWLSEVSLLADRFAVISRSTSTDLIKILSRSPALKAKPVIMRLDGDFEVPKKTNPAPNGLMTHDLPQRPYVLFIATLEFRKNHLFLFKAWLELLQKYDKKTIPLLICAGKRAWKFEDTQYFYDKNSALHNHIFILSGLSDEEISALYEGCLFTVFPSLYEGWGLPVSESLRFGKICLSADNSSLPEAGGKFADYFETGSIDNFIGQASRLIFDDAYRQRRQQLIHQEYRPRPWIDILGNFIADIGISLAKKIEIAKDNMASPDIAAVYLEYTDLLNFFRRRRIPSGIQRVQLELFHASQHSQGKTPIVSCAYDDKLKWWIVLDPKDLNNLLTLASQHGDVPDQEMTNTLDRIEASFNINNICVFPKKSVLINFGVLWNFTRYMDAVRAAKLRDELRFIPLVYDLIPIKRPNFFLGDKVNFNYWISLIVMLADQFIVISKYTMTEFIDTADTIKKIQNQPILMPLDGRSERRIVTQIHPDWLFRFQLKKGGFILYVSTIESRKNQIFAFQAWGVLLSRHRPEQIPQLVCIGQVGWNGEEAIEFLKHNSQLNTKILVVNNITDKELNALYENCLFTIYPSLYEGWGLPITESLSYGKICIAADNTSLPEAGGTLADYYKSESISDFMEKLEFYTFNQDARLRRECEIRTGYSPRSWKHIFHNMLEDIFAGLQNSFSFNTSAPTISLGENYVFSKKSFQEGLSRTGAVAELICKPFDWEMISFDGVWSQKSPSSLSFFLPPDINYDLSIYTEVQAPDHKVNIIILFQGMAVLATAFNPSQTGVLKLFCPLDVVRAVQEINAPFELSFQSESIHDPVKFFTRLKLNRFVIKRYEDDINEQPFL